MSHDIFKPSILIGCLENNTADSAQTTKRAIVTRPFPSPWRASGHETSVCVCVCAGGVDKRHVRRLLLSQLREVNTFFPSHVSVASTVPRYILRI